MGHAVHSAAAHGIRHPLYGVAFWVRQPLKPQPIALAIKEHKQLKLQFSPVIWEVFAFIQRANHMLHIIPVTDYLVAILTVLDHAPALKLFNVIIHALLH